MYIVCDLVWDIAVYGGIGPPTFPVASCGARSGSVHGAPGLEHRPGTVVFVSVSVCLIVVVWCLDVRA